MKNLIRAVAGMLALTLAMEAGAQCTGDIVADGKVDGGDLGVLLSNWGPVVPTSPASVASDIDGNGQINGADLGLLLSNWGYCPVTISGISPNQGCVVGGTEITLTGNWLGQASAVKIGGVACTGVTPISSTTLKATTPAGQLGPTAVTVTTPAGTFTASQTFTYMPASVSSIVPNAGLAAGGSLITVTGQYLALTTGLTIGGVPATSVTVVDANTITAVTPPGNLGNADLVITGGKGSTTVPGGFRYISTTVPSWATLLEAAPNNSVVVDPAMRAAIIATGRPWRVRDTATQMEMILIPPGSFQMGCVRVIDQEPYCYQNELPVHQVTLTNAFYLGRYEVTQAQWVAKMGSNPSRFRGQADSASRPVEQVSWNMIQPYLAATGMRLPTEAEWEYACRAGTQTPFYNGSTDQSTVGTLAWFGGLCCDGGASGETHIGGGKAPNAFGVFDMLGNVWEWTSDGWTDYSPTAQTDPVGPGGSSPRMLRGGGCYDSASLCRSSMRYFTNLSADYARLDWGFRVARNP
jgi:formylglycine-generating enzyme required for sulfatase activity